MFDEPAIALYSKLGAIRKKANDEDECHAEAKLWAQLQRMHDESLIDKNGGLVGTEAVWRAMTSGAAAILRCAVFSFKAWRTLWRRHV